VYPAKRAVVEEFVMSCRVMGKNIENAVLEDVEREVREAGFDVLEGVYLPTQKNQPVAKLYERLGYERVSADKTGEERYILRLTEDVKRDYRAVMMRENTVLKEVDGRKAGEK
jgi:predicted enzyme involved in methoxymalonyl-ACP biosynthesis